MIGVGRELVASIVRTDDEVVRAGRGDTDRSAGRGRHTTDGIK